MPDKPEPLSKSDEPFTTTARFAIAQRRSLVIVLALIVVVFVVAIASMWYALIHALDTVHEFGHDSQCRAVALAAEVNALNKIYIISLTDPGNTAEIDTAIQALIESDRVAEQIAQNGCT